MQKLLLRYLIFILGLYFLSLGVVLFVLSSLGTTPISSVNYILSLHLPITLGMATFAFNMVLIVIQFWLVRGGVGSRKDRIEILSQIPFSFVFSSFMDLNMSMFSWIHFTDYFTALCVLACGCLIQSIGVVLEVKPNVAAMSAEGVVKYISRRYGKEFGKTKVRFDLTLVTVAAVMSLLWSGHIEGLREGTAVAALCTGYIVSFLSLHVITGNNVTRVFGFAGKAMRRLIPDVNH